MLVYLYFVVVVQSISHVQLFATPWTAACQASLSFTIAQSLLKLMSIESMMLCNHLILCHPLLLLPSVFPNIRVFSSELTLHIRWPKYWSLASASVLSMCIQGSFPVGLTDLVTLLAKGLSRVLQHQFEGINSLALSLIYGPTLTSVLDYRKDHSFDYIDLCQQSDVFTF